MNPSSNPTGKGEKPGAGSSAISYRQLKFLIPPARRLYPIVGWLSSRKPFLRRVDLGEVHMLVSMLDMSVGLGLLNKGVWERLTTSLVREALRPGMVVLDIGAHVGYFILLAATSVGPAGKVFAFEPDERHVKLLLRNVEANDTGNVVVVPKAVSDATGRCKLRVNSCSPAVSLETVRLDDFFPPGQRRVDFVKMDIDGAEPMALAGMEGLLSESPEMQMLVEYDPWQHEVQGRSPGDFLCQLEQMGFRLHVAIDEAEGHVREITWGDAHEIRTSVNLWLVRPDG
jgi:FkbM family methyltransferase